MAYSNLIPRPTDQLNDSQQDLLNNFIAIQNLIDVNHVDFNLIDQGKHTQVTLPVNPALVTPTIANEANIYSRTSAQTGFTELAWQRSLNEPVAGPGEIIEFTASGRAVNGWTRLPSGILLKWTTQNVSAIVSESNAITITWPGVGIIPPFTQQFMVLANPVPDLALPAKDINCIFYVEDITNPLQVNIRNWRRNQFNVAGTNQGPMRITVFGIGI